MPTRWEAFYTHPQIAKLLFEDFKMILKAFLFFQIIVLQPRTHMPLHSVQEMQANSFYNQNQLYENIGK